MKIGIISDSHGKTARLQRAVDMLVARGAEAIVHCGDLGGEEALHSLGRSGRRAYAVGGNTDKHMQQLVRAAADAGVQFHYEVIEVPLGDGRLLIATHGHDEELVNELLAGGQFPYVCVGHTHRRRDERAGNVRLINPGALHRAVPHTVALLDVATDKLEFIDVPD